MIEADIEKYLCRRVKAAGGEIRKVKWIGRRHAPDRFVMLNGGHWVELKAPLKGPRKGQAREHKRMHDRGVKVHVISTRAQVDSFMAWLLIA
jgi:hypothetical protein